MDKGHIRQMAAPETLYREPADLMVAGFVGAGAVLPVQGVTVGSNGNCSVQLGQSSITARICPKLADGLTTVNTANAGLCLRPEDVWVTDDAPLRGQVDDCVYLGGRFRLSVRIGADQTLPVYANRRARIGEQVGLQVNDGWVFDRLSGEAA